MGYQIIKAIKYKNHPEWDGSHVYLQFKNGVKVHIFSNCDARGVNTNNKGVIARNGVINTFVDKKGWVEIQATEEEKAVGFYCLDNYDSLIALAV
jgi:hypothetical protein